MRGFSVLIGNKRDHAESFICCRWKALFSFPACFPCLFSLSLWCIWPRAPADCLYQRPHLLTWHSEKTQPCTYTQRTHLHIQSHTVTTRKCAQQVLQSGRGVWFKKRTSIRYESSTTVWYNNPAINYHEVHYNIHSWWNCFREGLIQIFWRCSFLGFF